MSFRGRLRLFFALIVIVPMIALGIVLFALTARTETGKADAGIGTAARTALAVHRDGVAAARPALRRVAADPRLRRAIVRGRSGVAERRMRELVRGPVVAIELWSTSGQGLVSAGSDTAVARTGSRARRPVVAERRQSSRSRSPTRRALVRRVERLTELDAAVYRDGRPLATTVWAQPASSCRHRGGRRHRRGRPRIPRARGVAGRAQGRAPVELAILRPSAPFSEHIADNRLLIVGFLVLFVLLALASATFVSRALTGQIATFLAAARRLSRGDFRQLVPVEGNDEFAQLGHEFNAMSEQLEAKIEEVERKRQELEETIRRVGDALATGLDRHGVVALAVRQAVDACEAEVGRALPLARGAFVRYDGLGRGCPRAGDRGGGTPRLHGSARMLVRSCWAPSRATRHRANAALRLSAHAGGAHALSIGLRSLVDGPEYLGAISIARNGKPFTREEEELLEYLAGQAVVSIENASLHETVERQAVTDDLTGLANMRAFTSILDREIERSRRFETPLGLVMMDIDDFKRVNDTYGHQQGDEVLAQVAGVLRDLSRDLDAPPATAGRSWPWCCPQTDAEGAALLAERMREAVEALRVPRVRGGGSLGVTASFGVASVPDIAPTAGA